MLREQQRTVVYIVGTARSGTSILGAALGQIDGWFTAGELRFLWDRGLHPDRLCGCRSKVLCCSFWRSVICGGLDEGSPPLEEVRGADAPIWGTTPTAALEAVRRVRSTPAFVAALIRPTRRTSAAFAETMAPAYRAVFEVSGASVVVDTSKLPQAALALARNPPDGLDVRVVHVVRDPRGTLFSMAKLADHELGHRHAAKFGAHWLALHAATELVAARGARVMRVRYEDFAAQPAEMVRQLAAWVDGSCAVPISSDGRFHVADNHEIAGGNARKERGEVQVVLDDSWKDGLSARAALVVNLVTAPLRWRYGYPLRARTT